MGQSEMDFSHAAPRLYGILITYRRPRELSIILERIARQDRALDRLLVVDNSPAFENEQAVDEFRLAGNAVDYLPQQQNLGPAGASSLGMEKILEFAKDHDWIVLFDDDDPPTSSKILGELARFAEEVSVQNGDLGCIARSGARFDFSKGRAIRLPDEELAGPVAVDYVGSNQFPLYRVEAVRRIGTFNGSMFFGFGELEYGLRLRRAGYSLYANGNQWAEARRTLHSRPGLGVRRPRVRLDEPAWRRYYKRRNLIYILRSFGRPGAALRVTIRGFGRPLTNLFLSPRRSLRHLRLTWKASSDAWAGRMGRRVEPKAL